MKVKYYKSIICPRCISTSRFLNGIKKRYPSIEIEEIEVLKNMRETKKAGIRSIPTIVIGDKRYQGIPQEDEFLTILQSPDKS